jgi:hypothetical protein
VWKTELTRWFRDLARLVGDWWRVDRVRVSPREGRLLRLQPPCLLVICERIVEIRERRLDPSGSWVVYQCHTFPAAGFLWARPGASPLYPRLLWLEGGVFRELTSEEVDVIGSEIARDTTRVSGAWGS